MASCGGGSFRRLALAGLTAVVLVDTPSTAQGPRDEANEKAPPEYRLPKLAASMVEVPVDSGFIANATDARTVIFDEVVEVPGAAWLRLAFEHALLGAAPPHGRNTILRMTSLHDGAVQIMNATHLGQWRRTSAYFNGDAIRVEIIADPDVQPSRISIRHIAAGDATLDALDKTICGTIDDRTLSNDPRLARAMPVGCTAWLIDDAGTGARPGCLLSAGHCFTSGNLQVIEFNVPLSNGDGSVRHPPPSDQYVVDPDSMQFTPGPNNGNDWGFFGCFPNSTTGLTPLEAQARSFTLAGAIPEASGQTLSIAGYGVTSPPVSATWNQVQKLHQGPVAARLGTILMYEVDTTGGNSGSGVELATDSLAIGIHTNGGCSDQPGTSNFGTAIDNRGLQQALHNPLGVCWPCRGPDTDGSGDVDIDDLLALLSSWGACAPECVGDGDLDGTIGVLDLLDMLGNWGKCPAGGPGPFVASPPENDLCADAKTVFDGVIEFDTTWATTDGPVHAGCSTGNDGGVTVNDIWFVYQASCTGMLEVSTCGISSYDTDLVLYEGSCDALGPPLACNDDASSLPCGNGPLWQSHIADVPVLEGETLLIRVGGWADATIDSGPGSLSITCVP